MCFVHEDEAQATGMLKVANRSPLCGAFVLSHLVGVVSLAQTVGDRNPYDILMPVVDFTTLHEGGIIFGLSHNLTSHPAIV
jgi:hypothetical protein